MVKTRCLSFTIKDVKSNIVTSMQLDPDNHNFIQYGGTKTILSGIHKMDKDGNFIKAPEFIRLELCP